MTLRHFLNSNLLTISLWLVVCIHSFANVSILQSKWIHRRATTPKVRSEWILNCTDAWSFDWLSIKTCCRLKFTLEVLRFVSLFEGFVHHDFDDFSPRGLVACKIDICSSCSYHTTEIVCELFKWKEIQFPTSSTWFAVGWKHISNPTRKKRRMGNPASKEIWRNAQLPLPPKLIC